MKKVLLDENLPRPLAKHFSDKLDVTTVPDMGWTSKENGDLLNAMTENGINILLTVVRNMRYQQNWQKYDICLVVILTLDNRYKTIQPHVPIIEEAILSQSDEKFIEVDIRKL